MNVGALIKSIFLCGIVWLIVMCFGVANGLSFKFVIITTLGYIFGVYSLYQHDKEKSTCPRCKKHWAWYEKLTDTETLSEGYISEDVKKSDNGREYYVRKGFRVGKERDYYRSTCKECGYTTERTQVSSYKREV